MSAPSKSRYQSNSNSRMRRFKSFLNFYFINGTICTAIILNVEWTTIKYGKGTLATVSLE